MHVNSSLLYKIIYLGRDLSQCLDISMMKRYWKEKHYMGLSGGKKKAKITGPEGIKAGKSEIIREKEKHQN